MTTKKTMRFGSYTFAASNLDKVLFPEAGITKGDLVAYYKSVASTMVPYVADRPLTMHRFPDGIGGKSFFQKETPDYFPEWIERETVAKEGGKVTHVLCQNAATLAYLADQAVVTPHVWLSRVDRLHHPDQMIFDLDPPTDDFAPVREAARLVRARLEELGLAVFVKTTGSRGLHLLVPLDRSADFDTVRDLAQRIAKRLAEEHADRLTVEQRKSKRGNRVFLDVGRNAYAQTAVAPYAVRAKPGAPVATPLAWEELEGSKIDARSFGLRSIGERLGVVGDPWKGLGRHARSLSGVADQLA